MLTDRAKEILLQQKELEKEFDVEKKKATFGECAGEMKIIVDSFIEQGFTREEAINILCACASSQNK